MATKKTLKTSPTSKKPATAARRSSTKAATKRPVAASKTVAAPAPPPSTEPGEVNKRELVERIMTETGMKKGQARGALDAVLGTLGQIFAEGKSVSAAPLGKVKLVRKKDTPNGELVVLRVKLKKPQATPADSATPSAKLS